MELATKFRQVAATYPLKIRDMELDSNYTIIHALSFTTSIGPTFQVAIQDSVASQYFIYLPQRFIYVFTDQDINDSNYVKVWLSMVYRGYCTVRKIPILELE